MENTLFKVTTNKIYCYFNIFPQINMGILTFLCKKCCSVIFHFDHQLSLNNLCLSG